MPLQSYSLPAGRINRIRGEILAHAVGAEVLGAAVQPGQHPRNSGDTIIYRRWVPIGASAASPNAISVDPNAFQLSEGVTPDARTLTPQDITLQLQEYGCLYGFSNRTAELYEDDVPQAEKEQAGETMGLINEKVRYGVFKAGTNAYFGGGGATRASVNAALSYPLLQKVAKNLLTANRAKMMKKIIEPGAKFSTKPIQAAFIVYCSTDAEPDIEKLPNYVPKREYPTMTNLIHDDEVGSCGRFRFVLSAELNPYLAAGAAIGTTGLVGSGNVDVYPFLVVAKNAWGARVLRGMGAVSPHIVMPAESAADPLAQRGYVGARWYFNAVVLNQGWMAVVEAGVTNVG
jgi:N4-gp56 family major capsid protein